MNISQFDFLALDHHVSHGDLSRYMKINQINSLFRDLIRDLEFIPAPTLLDFGNGFFQYM